MGADWALAVSSSDGGVNDGQNTVDGDTDTFWEATSNVDEWIVYDAQAEVSLAFVTLDLGAANGVQSAMIQVGDPFTDTWTTVVEFAVPENEETYTAVFGEFFSPFFSSLFIVCCCCCCFSSSSYI